MLTPRIVHEPSSDDKGDWSIIDGDEIVMDGIWSSTAAEAVMDHYLWSHMVIG